MGSLKNPRSLQAQAEQLAPFMKNILRTSGGGGSTVNEGSGIAVHDIGGQYHTGTLNQSQAPWAVDVSSFNVHRNTVNAHLGLATNSGLTTSNGLLTLGQPGTLSATSVATVSGTSHAHPITATVDGKGNPSTLLKSNPSGGIELSFLTVDLINADADTTIQPAGDLILDPAGNDVRPNTNYDINLGLINKKYLTLHAAELWVETLVAQNTIATIGGRILVGPTTTLIADLTAGATTVDVKHNQMASGDRVHMEADGKLEFMAITSGPTTIAGGYRYSLTRNLDGTGANEWYAGDAMFNTGTTGNGFIDLYSINGLRSSTNVSGGTLRAGPTIVGNVRLSGTYNDFRERWAIGSLNGLYDYSSEVYGFAAGDPTGAWIGVDATNGVRIMQGGSTEVIRLAANGDSYFAGVMTIGTSGEIRQGTGTLGSNYTGIRIWNSAGIGIIAGYNTNVLQWYGNTSGELVAGANNVKLNIEGITLYSDSTNNEDNFNEAKAITFRRLTGNTLAARITSYYLSSTTTYGLTALSQSPNTETSIATFGARRAGIVYGGSNAGYPRVVAEASSTGDILHLYGADIDLYTDDGYQTGTFSQTGYVVLKIRGTNYKFMVAPE